MYDDSQIVFYCLNLSNEMLADQSNKMFADQSDKMPTDPDNGLDIDLSLTWLP